MLARLTGATVAYDGAPVLGPLDLTLAPGRITALVGPSGCGKSTALRLLAGLQPPTAGSVDRAVGPGETGMVFQAPTLAPWLDARANVALPLILSGVPRTEARRRAEAELARVGLTPALHRKPSQLSGGMAMRAALARALVTRPRLLLLDEPFAALDALTRRALIDDVARLIADSGAGVLLVTHDVEEAAYMAHEVAVMSSAPGRILDRLDTPAVWPRPPAFRDTPAFRQSVEAVLTVIREGAPA